MPRSRKSRNHRKTKKRNFFGGSIIDTASKTGTQVLNTVSNTADQAGTGIQNFFTDNYNKLFKKQSSSGSTTSSNYTGSTGGSRRRVRKGGSRKRRGGFSFPKNPSLMAKPVNYMKGGYAAPQALSQNAGPTKNLLVPYSSHGGRRSKKGGFYKAMSDRNYSLAGRGPSISGAPFPGTTAQPHHWVGKAQRWVGPSGNAAFLH